MLNFFRRGRGLTALGALGAVLLAVAIMVDTLAVRKVLLIAAVGVAFFFIVMRVSSEKKVEGYTRELLRRVGKVEKVSEELRVEQEKHERVNRERKLSELAGLSFSLRGEEAEGSKGLLFAPDTISASRILDRPAAQSAGRFAAAQTMDGDAFEILRAVECAPREARQRSIELIGSNELENALRMVGNVERLTVPHRLGGPNKGTAYLIIDERAFGTGAWAGTLSSQSTARFLRLDEHIRKSKAQGVIIIVMKTSQQDHFSNSLRQAATVLLDRGKPDWEWEDDMCLPVMNVLISESQGREM